MTPSACWSRTNSSATASKTTQAPTATTPWSAKPSTIWASATASAAVPPRPDSIAAAWSRIPPGARGA
ncbi:hypothetical protein G6F65_023318 [Rhizopus arrhizus]|nr:hypothetical protein G6F65_023318 [Rhizopus arrhizus]